VAPPFRIRGYQPNPGKGFRPVAADLGIKSNNPSRVKHLRCIGEGAVQHLCASPIESIIVLDNAQALEHNTSMNKLHMSKRVAVVSALVEGNSLRSTCRMTGVAMNTVLKLLADLGETCAEYHEQNVRDISAKRIQCDEIWQYVYAKAKNVPQDKQGTFGFGDVWTWTAIDADSKLIVSYL